MSTKLVTRHSTLRTRYAAAVSVIERFLTIDDWSDELIAPADLIFDARQVLLGSAVSPAKPAAATIHLPIGRFTFADAGCIVCDAKTRLMWMRDTLGGKKAVNFADAERIVRTVDLGGFTDWRLPTREELLSLVDDTRHSPAIDTTHFNCESGFYWSSAPYANNPDFAWGVYFHCGYSGIGHRYGYGFVRAVRSVLPASPSQ